MYQLHFTILDKIIKKIYENDIEICNYINNFIEKEYEDSLKLEPIKFE